MVDKIQQSLQFYSEMSKKEEQAQAMTTTGKESTKGDSKEKKVTLPQVYMADAIRDFA